MQTQDLSRALARLVDLADDAATPGLRELQRRLRERRFRVLIAGEAKRGKSTLLNAMLHRDLLPTGAIPVTAVMTTVAHGRPERIVVRHRDGAVAELPLDHLAEHVTEAGNPGNRRGVEQVTVLLDDPLLADGLELVDTPGVGSVYDHDEEAERAFATMDAAVFVLTADPPISAGERHLLDRVLTAAVRVFVVLNKADRLDATELAQAADFVREVLSVGSRPVELFACSAREALRARLGGGSAVGTGLPELETALLAYLSDDRDGELRRSLARRAHAVAAELLDAVRITLRADALRGRAAAERVEAFAARVDRVARGRAEAEDLVAGGVRRLLSTLNADAEEAERVLAAKVAADARARLDAELGAAAPAELQAEGHRVVADVVRDAVQGWRDAAVETLEVGIRDLEQRLLTALAEQLTELAAVARELLELDLVARPDPSRLPADVDFFYLLVEDVGQTELLAGAIRRRLPGRWGRARVLAYLAGEADRLTRQQVGRSRADLQERLQRSGRSLQQGVAARWGASLGRVHAALEEAERLSSDPAATAARATLQVRQAALQEVLLDLECPPSTIT
jgi:GTP-binding protein EngB required for normal cell division